MQHDARQRIARPGFTIVESVVSLLVVSLILVAALNAVGAAARTRTVQARGDTGHELARDLMTEVLSMAYEEPVDPKGFGPEPPETTSSRSSWDDVDDYAGYVETTLSRKKGTALAGYDGWSRAVDVTAVDAKTLADKGTLTTSGLKLVTVTVTAPSGEQTAMQALRSAHAPTPLIDTSYVTRAAVELQIGEAPQATMASTELLNPVEGSP